MIRSLLAVLGLLIGGVGCQGRPPEPPTDASAARPSSAPPQVAVRPDSPAAPSLVPSTPAGPRAPRFVDHHREWGFEFEYDTGASGKELMVESTGGGGGWIDYDRDGRLDLVMIQGGDPLASIAHPTGDRLFRQRDGRRFFDDTGSSRLIDAAYGQGLAVGDYDGDGFEDLLVTNVGPDVLYHNEGDGTFRDVTAEAGVADPRWGSSAAWFDLDGDSDLDLFVCNYVKYDIHNPVSCRRDDGTPAICHPEMLDPELSECYENLGDGRFQPVASAWGLRASNNKALGVVIGEFTGDDRPDVFVANDVSANHLFVATGARSFEERAVELGCAYNTLGQYQANMGIGCHDYDNNGRLDLYVTHFTHDSNTLYANLGSVGFRDVTRVEGLHKPTLDLLGFGTVMADLNADGAMDLFVANGHIDDWRHKGDAWKMRPQLFSYNGRTWQEHRADVVGPFLDEERLGRAVSMGDVDRDGDPDLLVVHQHDPAALLINESDRGRWLQIELCGRGLNRRAIGARVTVQQGANRWIQQAVAGTSYLAAHEPVLCFGLGDSNEPCEVLVEWPPLTGHATRHTVAVNQRHVLVEPRSVEASP
jgi:enediyne biosynthesis protein E4